MASMNPWEASALQHQFSSESKEKEEQAAWAASQSEPSTTLDKLIYPGLYSASGLDIMGILLWTVSRPNPTVDIGPVDASVPLILCDLTQPDQPIVYASEPFLEMTGYSKPEVLGKNCRFLQTPGGKARPPTSDDAVKRMKKAIQENQEIQLEIENYKKDGTKFRNMLTIIPVQWRSLEYTYSLGLQCEYTG